MRRPAFAGRYYPGSAQELRAEVTRLLDAARQAGAASAPPARGYVVPHAGLRYSGAVAACAYAALGAGPRPSTVALVGPAHDGASTVAVSGEGWETPLGFVPLDREVQASLRAAGIPEDERPHAREHALEVQLPFLQALWPADPPRIVCLAMGAQDAGTARRVASALRGALPSEGAVILASCDLAHEGAAYGRPTRDAGATARDKGERFLAAVESLDPDEIFAAVHRHDLSSCGHAPVAALLGALRPTRVRRLASGTSTEVETHDSSVAYAALALE